MGTGSWWSKRGYTIHRIYWKVYWTCGSEAWRYFRSPYSICTSYSCLFGTYNLPDWLWGLRQTTCTMLPTWCGGTRLIHCYEKGRNNCIRVCQIRLCYKWMEIPLMKFIPLAFYTMGNFTHIHGLWISLAVFHSLVVLDKYTYTQSTRTFHVAVLHPLVVLDKCIYSSTFPSHSSGGWFDAARLICTCT